MQHTNTTRAREAEIITRAGETEIIKLLRSRRHNKKPAENLAELEAENATLRHQAVELALRIQELQESRFL